MHSDLIATAITHRRKPIRILEVNAKCDFTASTTGKKIPAFAPFAFSGNPSFPPLVVANKVAGFY